jgi:indolepyruvate ferredoxin oxidoreductase
VETALQYLTPESHALCVELLSLPDHIRGYGPVKEAHLREARARRADIMSRLSGDNVMPVLAARRAA